MNAGDTYEFAPSAMADISDMAANAVGESVEIDLFAGQALVGYARVETASSSLRRLFVCASAGSVFAEVDTGAGVLQTYEDTADGLCRMVELTAIRKFRAFFWLLAPGPGSGAVIGLGLGQNLPRRTGTIVGSATIGYPGGVPDIHVCAVPGFGTMNAEIDPGSGNLKHYQATGNCTDSNPGNSLRKFLAWYWASPPPL
jgi:hypothetical protein